MRRHLHCRPLIQKRWGRIALSPVVDSINAYGESCQNLIETTNIFRSARTAAVRFHRVAGLEISLQIALVSVEVRICI